MILADYRNVDENGEFNIKFSYLILWVSLFSCNVEPVKNNVKAVSSKGGIEENVLFQTDAKDLGMTTIQDIKSRYTSLISDYVLEAHTSSLNRMHYGTMFHVEVLCHIKNGPDEYDDLKVFAFQRKGSLRHELNSCLVKRGVFFQDESGVFLSFVFSFDNLNTLEEFTNNLNSCEFFLIGIDESKLADGYRLKRHDLFRMVN